MAADGVAVRAVIFDLYDTLFYTGPTDTWERAIARLQEAGVSEEQWLRGWDATYVPTVKGRYSMLGRVKLALGLAGRRDPDQRLCDEVAGLLHVRSYPQLFPDVRPTLAEVRARGYRLGLLSNIPYDEAGMIEALELPDLFDVVVLSSLVGSAKPEPPVYVLTAERLGVPATQCVLVDDAASYVAGARAVGMIGVRIRRPDRPPQPEVEDAPDLEITNLQQFLDWLPAQVEG